MLKPFQGIHVLATTPSPVKRRFSVTQDVVGYRRCARQYGALKVHKYAPAHQTQLYFGTIIHQVLDHCHAHYHGTMAPSTQGQIPDSGHLLTDAEIRSYLAVSDLAGSSNTPMPPPPSDIIAYFCEVENGLKSQGIRAITPDLRVKAIRILQYFNALEGTALYPRVRDTEHRLQADRGSHILHGVVDLLLDGPNGSDDPSECEIWDYKGTERVGMKARDLETYLFQMRVYAHLYQLKHGILPKRVVLYFLNELDGPTPPQFRPANALLTMDIHTGLSTGEIDAAMAAFTQTVTDIEASRAADTWVPAAPGTISDQDCAICDLRWDCPTPNAVQPLAMRYP